MPCKLMSKLKTDQLSRLVLSRLDKSISGGYKWIPTKVSRTSTDVHNGLSGSWKEVMDSEWLKVRAVSVGMRIIYEGLETLPLSPAGKGVLTRHLTNLQQMAVFDKGVYLVGYTDRLT